MTRYQIAEFKDAARTTWATGNYDAMMRQEGLYEVGQRLVAALGIGPGDELVDIACGTGNAAVPAAAAGARVTGIDLTPEMLAVARRRAGEASVEVTWVEGDAEALPCEDQAFDVVVSTFGCMFAPRHEEVATEIARVLRPGGRLGLCTWTPEGSIGDFFRTVVPYLPPPPDFVDLPLTWGVEEHVRDLFEGTGIEMRFERHIWHIGHDSVDAAVRCYTTTFGPTVQARQLADADGRGQALRHDMADLFTRHNTTGGDDLNFPAEYLVALGNKATAAR